MLNVPLTANPSQKLSVLLAGQNCQISVYQKTTGMYLDLAVNNAAIKSGIVCRDRVLLIRHAYLDFVGDLTFFDTQGVADPEYTGLGARWQLVYLEAGDLA
ncbi:hypothetical protein WM11_21570 [Burkholderia ubonensis]|uniref:phage baseplate plug family protein n=1 Tax=Burkholderia ubonensis TaxID=101571 RepID=UPI00075F3B08|nr:hypothetical protein [Burkholderia ubonensis]KWI89678.1 hypothetical protein WM10_17475 [Burkholderia ubonensis]KWI99332.1 hypothetical protein WM11_21570 [Burkholderia ubonensis]KWK03370.1 hypothetical protein WM12_27850 [Burkholderia ubonensis]KWK44344.1 hypothetical protein WM14_11690 [Burkholderia ubonensis]KWK46433.1 hypothetical protein WM13_06260 [Burkholderia ubonensis]